MKIKGHGSLVCKPRKKRRRVRRPPLPKINSITIRREILEDEELTSTEKLVLGLHETLGDKHHVAVNRAAEMLGIGLRSAYRAVSRLIELELL